MVFRRIGTPLTPPLVFQIVSLFSVAIRSVTIRFGWAPLLTRIQDALGPCASAPRRWWCWGGGGGDVTPEDPPLSSGPSAIKPPSGPQTPSFIILCALKWYQNLYFLFFFISNSHLCSQTLWITWQLKQIGEYLKMFSIASRSTARYRFKIKFHCKNCLT